MTDTLDIAVLGLSLRSAWGNGHATTWRALLRALLRRGHRVRFYERERSWYAQNQDLPKDLAECLVLYDSLESLRATHASAIVTADVVMLGSLVPQGASMADWLLCAARGITAFYDIDVPLTLAMLRDGRCDYLRASQIAKFDLYLSATGGPSIARLIRDYGACAKPLYCSVDPERYAPAEAEIEYDLGYIGTYSSDRQRLLRWYLLGVAKAWPEGRFIVAGPQYPDVIAWPANVTRIEHLAPVWQRAFYATQAFTLNLACADMIAAGWSPSVWLFEAAACGVPVICDAWPGLDDFFVPGEEILVAQEPGQVLEWMRRMPTTTRHVIGAAARRRVLAEHTGDHRAETLQHYIDLVVPRFRTTPVAHEQAS